MSQTLGSQLARHEEAAREWSAERQAIKDEEDRLRATLRTVNETIASERKHLAQVERELDAARQERAQLAADRDAAAADRDRAREAVEAAEREASGLHAQLATGAAELTRLRDQFGMVTRDRDALQADQIQWGLDRERLLAELNPLKAHAGG